MSDLFRQKAPGIMSLLMQDFALDEESAAAILGNLGHESAGFRQLQEGKPMVAGSRGGWGWAQWTADRRVAFEAYVARNGFDPSSDTANYKWLFLELKGLVGSEGRAIPAVKNAVGLAEKVKAFELAFERAADQYKHYESRNQWAEKALAAYRAGGWSPLQIGDAAPEQPRTEPVILPPLAPGQIDLTQILALLAPVLQQVLASRAPGGTTTGQPDILALLSQLLAPPKPALPPPAPVEPPQPKPASNSLSMILSILLGAGTAAGMSTGTVGTPFELGVTPTPTGSLMTIASIVSPLLSYFGGYGMLASGALNVVTRLAQRLPATPK